MFKKIRQLVAASIILASFAGPLLCGGFAYAVPINQPCTDKAANSVVCKDINATGDKNPIFGPDGILTVAVKILSIIVGIGAIFVIIFQAIRIITSNGDPQSVTTARNGILYALIGVIVAASAQALVAFVLNRV